MKPLTFSNRVREGRRSKGLSQKELADAVGVTRQTIGMIEADNYNPSIQLCLLISQATGLSMDDLFYIKEKTDS